MAATWSPWEGEPEIRETLPSQNAQDVRSHTYSQAKVEVPEKGDKRQEMGRQVNTGSVTLTVTHLLHLIPPAIFPIAINKHQLGRFYRSSA